MSFAYRFAFSTPVLENACRRICEMTGGVMDRVFLVSGGSEATEISVKIARKYHLEKGQGTRRKIISRWISYHGMTQGALSWSGMPLRRADYDSMLDNSVHIPPGYCYRCWFNQTPKTCHLECAQALENEILCQGPKTVAAFIAEPLSGTSLCGAYPRPDYFKKIREICDRYGVLLIFDEVITGFGRTGKWFGYEQFDIVPDIMAVGKGMSGGYFPIGAAVVTADIAKTIENGSGSFAAGFTWSGNPLASAVALHAIDYHIKHNTINQAAIMGRYLQKKLETLRWHPAIGDIRGMGMLWGIEFVGDKNSRRPLDAALEFSQQLYLDALQRGLYLLTFNGCDRGKAGDMALFSPAFISTEAQIDEMVDLFEKSLTALEKRNNLL